MSAHKSIPAPIETGAVITTAIDGLEGRYRQILALRHTRGMSRAQLGAALGLDPEGTAAWLDAAYQALIKALAAMVMEARHAQE